MIQVFNFYSRRNEWFVQYNVEQLRTEPQIFRMLPVIPSIGIRVDL
jgi:hypothetical protein